MIQVISDRLIVEKFIPTSTWERDGHGQAHINGDVPAQPGVYLFVIGGKIYYVGSAVSSLRSRMASYRRRQNGGLPSRPVHIELSKALDEGKLVEVFTLVIPEPIEVGREGLPVDYAIGLEAGLIRTLNPPWNRRGSKLVLDEIDGGVAPESSLSR